MSQSTTQGIVNIKLQDYLALTSSTLSGRARVRNKQVIRLDSAGLLVAVTDWLWNETYYLITDVVGPKLLTGTPLAADQGQLTRAIIYGLDNVFANPTPVATDASGNVQVGIQSSVLLSVAPVSQGIPSTQSNRWPVFVSDGTAERIGAKISTNCLPVVLATDQILRAAPAIQNVLKQMIPYAAHLTTNVTTTPTAATCWVSSVAINDIVGGTGSTLTIQSKEATPKILVNAFVTTGVTALPSILSFPQPILMTSGIDIITAGVAPATVDVWITYWQ